ncbi:substrate-binding protein [Pseudohoeflea coraliihabitans]|uniref:Substrate-binding protein n=1 Tax=Pseudohoeflea coraliihabitans TaxID=2860393 RepID=A0ABS6WJS9_9HYPH|nr:substrate-binding protein [Pseudohoeflea sp. DP4N28-3]MBW3096020.1 substrate-binding protein [Pseudohoeflea sp. DP4N28-3]
MTWRFRGKTLVAVLALTGSFAIWSAAPGRAQETGAKLGFVTELSGPASLFGEAALQAAELAVDEVNASGGVLGGDLTLAVADDATDPNIARQVWEKLVNDGVDAFVFRETSAARVAVLPVAEAANVPAIYANDYEGGDCRRILYTAGEIEPQKIAPYLEFLKQNGGTKFFVLATDYNWARITAGMVREAAPGLEIEIVGEEYTPFNTTDYGPIITKIRNSGAEVLFSGLVGGPDNVAFFKQARSAGLTQSLKVIGNIALDDSTLAAVGDAAAGTYMAASYFMTDTSEANTAFLAALESKYGGNMKAQGYLSEPAYDAVHLYALAVNKAGTTETSAVLKALSEVEFTKSPKGSIRMTPDRHAAMPIFIAEAKADGTYEVKESLGVQEAPKQCDPQPPFEKG